MRKKVYKMKNLLGYDYVDGKLVINEAEANIAKRVFAKQKEYVDNPPKELVDAVLAIAQEKGEILTYEEAKEKVSYSAILEYMAREFNANTEFIETLNKSKTYPSVSEQTGETNSHTIVSKEIWDKAQEKIKK